MSRKILYIGNDNVCELSGLKKASEDTYINDATVELTLLSGEQTVTGPISMNYVSGSDGVYRGAIADDVELEHNAWYTARVIADAGPGLLAKFEIPVRAKARTL